MTRVLDFSAVERPRPRIGVLHRLGESSFCLTLGTIRAPPFLSVLCLIFPEKSNAVGVA